MIPNIDVVSFDKAKAYPARHGYQLRGTVPTSIVVHSTSNSVLNTSFLGEVKFLFESPDVSAHYIIAKDSRIVRFLEPAPWQAWHAGQALDAFQNARSIGIELHHSVGDPFYPQLQLDALAWLIKDLMHGFSIPLAKIETHGQIALPGPYLRKHDPADWAHDDFLRWRATLVSTPPTPPRYRTLAPVAIFETPTPRGPIALGGTGILAQGDIVEVEERPDGWHHLKDGRGFLPVGVLEKVG